MASKICPKCGFHNSTRKKFCVLCNNPLNGEIVKGNPFKSSFYDIQKKNRRNSVFLVFILMIILMILGYFIGEYFDIGYLGVIIAFVFASISSLIAYFNGKNIVLKMSGAKKVDKQKDLQVINIVEEISIAAGLPCPEVYIIETNAMNAFATGRDPQHSAIAITRGLINTLNREELSGVIAHEMSHVRHYDIRFATLVGVLVGTIVMISDFTLRYFFFGGRRRRSNNKKSGGGGVLILIVIVLAIITPLLAKIIQMSVSRKRELLADAGAAELTRNPEGLASALEKLAQSKVKLETANRATQHMYIVNPLKNFSKKSSALFSTHPPIEARIRILRSM